MLMTYIETCVHQSIQYLVGSFSNENYEVNLHSHDNVTYMY